MQCRFKKNNNNTCSVSYSLLKNNHSFFFSFLQIKFMICIKSTKKATDQTQASKAILLNCTSSYQSNAINI